MAKEIYEIYEKRERQKMNVHPGAATGVWECAENFLLAVEKLFRNKEVRSVETGLGLSTAVFCNFGWEHTSIVPSMDEKNQLVAWMKRNGIPTEKLTVIVDFSYSVVPSPSIIGEFDFVFIDGNHGFPHPYIDYFYLARKIKIGGFLAIDDINLEVPKYLLKQIREKKYWSVIEEDSKWVILQLIGPNLVAQEDWND